MRVAEVNTTRRLAWQARNASARARKVLPAPGNFLFAGSDAGGERAAIAYTILGSCRLAGIDPVEYLADVMPKLARRVRLMDLPAMLPARWAAAREAAKNVR